MEYSNLISEIYNETTKMKNLLIALFVFHTFSTFSQITITGSDLPSVNDTFRLSRTIDSWGINPALTGTGYTWDFSFLTSTSQSVDTCFSVSSTPFAYQFYFNNIILYPSYKADFAMKGAAFTVAGFLTVSDVYDYYKKSSSMYQNVGFGATINSIPMSIRKQPIENIYPLPLNFGATYSNFSAYDLSIPGFMTYRQTKNKSAEVDGWGTLTTPYGTFNTLRIKFIIDATDSINIDSLGLNFVTPRPTETQYHWLANGQDVPVLQINETSGIISQIIYKDKISVIGLNELNSKINFNIYPNPAFNELTVESSEEIKNLLLTDLSGKTLFSFSPYNKKFGLNVEEYSQGSYFIKIETKNGISTRIVSLIK